MPNKTIYVSDGDLDLFTRAQELAGGNLSNAISRALRRWVDAVESHSEGFEDVTVRVGVGNGRKVKFTAILVGQLVDATNSGAAKYRVFQGRTGKYVLHVERSPEFSMLDADGKPAGWKGHLGIGNVSYAERPKQSTLDVVATLEELRPLVPDKLFDMVALTARQPTVEELDV